MFHSILKTATLIALVTVSLGASFTKTASAQMFNQNDAVATDQEVQGGGGNGGGMASMFGAQTGRPQNGQGNAGANPLAANWLVALDNEGNKFRARLTLKPDGQFEFFMGVAMNGNSGETRGAGSWKAEGNFLVLVTDGEVERLPFQFDGTHLVVDIPTEGVRIGFARNPQQSFVQPLQPMQHADPYSSYKRGGSEFGY